MYWAGRYLERTEATARLVKVHSELILDLPKNAGFGWSPLLAVTGTSQAFEEHHSEHIEEDVIRFLTVDSNSSTSILNSLTAARYNFRLTRNVLPASAWEQLNQLFLWVVQSRTLSVDRRSRNGCMDRVIRDCQMLRGLLDGTMSHDEAYSFWVIGSLVERADMTTRVLDVQAGVLSADAGHRSAGFETYSDLTWTTMLRSLSAEQMFRRTSKSEIASGSEALRFLLCDPAFPRSVEHCLTQISRSLLELPRYEAAMLRCADVQSKLVGTAFAALDATGLHLYMDELQVAIGDIHDAIADTFFVASALVNSSEKSKSLFASA